MKAVAVAVALIGAWLVLRADPVSHSPLIPEPGEAYAYASPVVSPSWIGEHGTPADPDALTAVVQRNCVICHNDRMLTGNISFSDFHVSEAPEKIETAERMIRKLRAGMMPPPGMPRPAGDTLQMLVETLENLVDAAVGAAPDPGIRRFQRLSRREYERVVRDLLALDVDAGNWLPADTYLGSFDNMADAQGLSTTLATSYLRAAADVSRLAFGNPEAVQVVAKYTNPVEVSQHAWDHIEGAPYGTRGGMVLTHTFPADGEYVIEVETLFGTATGFEDLDISIDGEPVALLALENSGDRTVPIRTKPIFVQAGQRQVSAAFVRRIEGLYDDRFRTFQWSFVGGEDSQAWANFGIVALPHVDDVLITGPLSVAGVSETPSREKILTCSPTAPAEQRSCAESILTRLATEAYRRPVDRADVDGLMDFYDDGSSDGGGFERGVRSALQALLASPEFVFRLERQPANVRTDAPFKVSDMELATRLSFFLWATGPDEELMRVASNGRLSERSVLEAQVHRMIADPRAEALATRFAHQWLRLQDVEKVQPEPFLYPDFNRQVANALVKETELFFMHLIREDRSLIELFNADYTFVNDRLARHYGIEGVTGSEFQLVQYPDDRRRGILGHGSVHLLTSMANRTSPVLRGKWVMQVLMGTPPPNPPANVPPLEQTNDAPGRRITTRERMEIHRANPMCASCHRFMDPIGLALDNFDVTGQWRIRENMTPLDTRGDFYDETPVNSPSDLTAALLRRPIPLVRNYTANLLSYAIGRPVGYTDQAVVRGIAKEAESNDYKMSSFILGVVTSDLFQTRRAQITSNDGGN